MSKITDQLKRDEGFVPHAYEDHLGYLTIGIGRLIDKRKGGGITSKEAEYLLGNDVVRCQDELDISLTWFHPLDEARKGVLINMAFQLGNAGVLKFKKMLEHASKGDYIAAADEMLKSKWAEQTPMRAQRLAKQMITGVWQ